MCGQNSQQYPVGQPHAICHSCEWLDVMLYCRIKCVWNVLPDSCIWCYKLLAYLSIANGTTIVHKCCILDQQ